MALDSDNHSKGFAFVEFEEEARPFCQDPYLYRLTYYPHVGGRCKGSRRQQLRTQEAQDRGDAI
jgi:hypothetical protein